VAGGSRIAWTRRLALVGGATAAWLLLVAVGAVGSGLV
jgi:hypothetical protein